MSAKEDRSMSLSGGEIRIVEATDKAGMRDFIEFPLFLYKGDPRYSPQLCRDLQSHFTPKNPFFKNADVSFILAFKNGKLAGRIASIINHLHIEVQNEKIGFFGFFECINDCEVARALLDAVCQKLKANGLLAIRGPMNFSINEECGFLIDGFSEPPLLMTPYNPPYYDDIMKACGLVKAKDLHAYIRQVVEGDVLPEKMLRVAAIAGKKGIKARLVKKDNFMEAMRGFREVFNASWEKNWGFIPITEDELEYESKRLKPFVVPDLTIVAEKDGEAIGFMCMMPDFNLALRAMKGRLNPVTIVKALYYYLKITDLRMMLLGIKPEYRNKGVDAVLLTEGFKGVQRGKYTRVEFSWILEDNINVIRLTEMIGASLYKRYRIYEKDIR
jgi:GNAT superfamily N-acetyltransferase